MLARTKGGVYLNIFVEFVKDAIISYTSLISYRLGWRNRTIPLSYGLDMTAQTALHHKPVLLYPAPHANKSDFSRKPYAGLGAAGLR
jgi:hypothetical protein